MADNTVLDSGTGGDTIRTEDRSGTKTPVSLIDVGGTSGEALIGDAGNRMPVEGAAAENAAAAGLRGNATHLCVTAADADHNVINPALVSCAPIAGLF